MVKKPPVNAEDARDMSSTPGLKRSPGGGNGNSLQYFSRKIPWTEDSDGIEFMESQRTEHN